MAGGFWKTADDAIRVATNGVTFGLADKAVTALGGETDSAARTAAARERLGIAGDVLNAATFLVGPGAALKLGGLGIKAAKTAWAGGGAAVRAAGGATRGLGTAAVRKVIPTHVGNATARSRLGLEAAPGIGARVAAGSKEAARSIVGARTAAFAAKHPLIAGAGGAGAVAFGTSVGHQSRTEGSESPVAQARAQAAAAGGGAAPKKAATPEEQTAAIMALIAGEGGVDPQNPTFADMYAQTAQAQGGQISMRQMETLSEIAGRTTPKAGKLPNAKDAAMQRLQSYYDGVHEQELKSGVPQATADENWARRYEDMMKMDPLADMLRGPQNPEEGN